MCYNDIMKTHSFIKTVLKLSGATAAAAGLLTYLTAPGRASDTKKAPFKGRTYAHRGLHTQDKTVPENSLAAFRRAVDAGYGIELDLQLTRDGKVVVFHDDTLERLFGANRPVNSLTFEELRTLRLSGTDELIPSIGEVLDLVDGRVPLLIELKPAGKKNAELCERACEFLDVYDGPYMVESFDPRIVAWFRFNRPDILRGQLAGPPSSYRNVPFWAPYVFGLCLANFLGRPQFIAYELKKKPLTVRLAEALGAMKVCWTSHNIYMHEGQDAVIFEFYEPDPFL